MIDYLPYLESRNFDYAITGEGEIPMKILANCIAEKRSTDKVPGLVKKIGHKKYIINPTERITDLSLLPRPARYLTNMEAYFDIGSFHSSKSRSKRVLNIMCSRGCPEKCTFCTTPAMWGNITRWRPIPKIMEENDLEGLWRLRFDTLRRLARLTRTYINYSSGRLKGFYKNLKIEEI